MAIPSMDFAQTCADPDLTLLAFSNGGDGLAELLRRQIHKFVGLPDGQEEKPVRITSDPEIALPVEMQDAQLPIRGWRQEQTDRTLQAVL